jgi:predicted Zn-dependent protease
VIAFFTRLTLPVALAGLLTACGTAPQPRQWDAAVVGSSTAPAVVLKDSAGRAVRTVDPANVRRLLGIAERVRAASRQEAALTLVDDATINAYAGYSGNQKVVGVNFGLLDRLQPTDDEFAALLAHEHAHFALQHYEANQTRHATLSVVQILADIALGVAGVPFGGTATDFAMQAFNTTFTRDQEKAADLMSLDFMRAAGFEPRAAVSLQRKLEEASHGAAIPFLSSHPSSSDRIAYLEERLRATGGAPAQ